MFDGFFLRLFFLDHHLLEQENLIFGGIVIAVIAGFSDWLDFLDLSE
jgi:hypothetical protein